MRTIVAVGAFPQKRKGDLVASQILRFTYADFQTAALTNTIPLFTLRARERLDAVMVYHSEAVDGGGISSLTAEIGINSDHDRYLGPYDINSAPSATQFEPVEGPWLESMADETEVNLYLTADANLSGLTTGAVEVYVWKTMLPA